MMTLMLTITLIPTLTLCNRLHHTYHNQYSRPI